MQKKQETNDLSKKLYEFSKIVFKLSQNFPSSPAGFAVAKTLLKSSTALMIHYEDMANAFDKKEAEIHRIQCYMYARRIFINLNLIKDTQLVSENLEDSILESAVIKNILSKPAAVENV
jgi:hypothetical protein